MAKSNEIRRVKIGMLGSGTVGNAIQELVFNGNLADKLGVMVEMVKIYTRHPKQKKWYSTHPSLFTTKAHEVTDHPDIDIVIEVLGSQQKKDLSIFKDYVIRAMQNGKAVVTSDKVVLATYGKEIWAAADKYGQEIGFEASVAWRGYLPDYLPLPHPSWRTTAWERKNPWFMAEVVPELRARVRALL